MVFFLERHPERLDRVQDAINAVHHEVTAAQAAAELDEIYAKRCEAEEEGGSKPQAD